MTEELTSFATYSGVILFVCFLIILGYFVVALLNQVERFISKRIANRIQMIADRKEMIADRKEMIANQKEMIANQKEVIAKMEVLKRNSNEIIAKCTK